MGTLHEDVFTFMTISPWFLLRMRNGKVIKEIKIHKDSSTRSHSSTQTHAHTRARAHARACPRKYLILIAFHGNSGFVNAPQCYVIRWLALSFVLRWSFLCAGKHKGCSGPRGRVHKCRAPGRHGDYNSDGGTYICEHSEQNLDSCHPSGA
jgi:hypothetical protein